MSAKNRPAATRVLTRIKRLIGRAPPFPVDVTDQGDEFVVSAELPGVRKRDIHVRARRNEVQIVAKLDRDTVGTYLTRERGRGRVSRVVELPAPVNLDHVSATYDDGILWVTLEKRYKPLLRKRALPRRLARSR
ncbi:Hsp20/alpha crystallin family protein [Haloarchaeobius sp. DFWS5]|uniref:Hsp20/alpha crystallin family protein n=1 Tax=Haloarchaeobius sp. DFWS5 TaxID=3446114 RepID=UPI003EB71D42